MNDKMNLKFDYLDYLEYVLRILNSDISRGFNIDDIKLYYNKESDIKIDNNAQRHFERLYENKYIERTGNSRLYRIKPDIKSIIDKYGSLSAHLEFIEKESIRKEIKETEFKKLQSENLILQNKLIRLQTKQQKRYVLYSFLSFVFGAIITNGKEILQFLHSVFQE